MTNYRELVLAGDYEEFKRYCAERGRSTRPSIDNTYYVSCLNSILEAPPESPFYTYGTWYMREDADTLLCAAHKNGLSVMRTR